MNLDHDLLHTEILIKLSKKNKSQRSLCKELDMHKDVIRGLRKGIDIKSSSLIKLIKWLDQDLRKYL